MDLPTGLLIGGSVLLTVLGVAVLTYGALRWRKMRRRRQFAVYGTTAKTFRLPKDGDVQYVQWLHPKETAKEITQSQVDALRQFVQSGDMVIDIGAHTGDTTIPLALAAGRTGCTLALEPNPYVFAVLKANAALNRDKTNIVPLNCAATSRDGRFTFHYSDGGYCNGGFLSQIHSRRTGHEVPLEVEGRDLQKHLLQHFADWLPRLSYIKIDTEGYDCEVIRSLMGIIQQYRPVLVCEVYSKLTRPERDALFDTLHDCGYDCFRCTEERLPGDALLRDDLSKWKHFDLLALPRRQACSAA